MSVIDDIKARIDTVELISQTVKLRKSGRAYMGLCPFHAHKNNTPSFAVWPDTGTWRCFGQCNEGGDIFKFVMKRDGLDFSGALQLLAGLAGVELKPRTPEQVAQDDQLNHLRQLLEAAAVYYHHLLRNAPQARHAREHLAQRGLTDKAIEMFQLGYALDAWDAALNYLKARGYTTEDLLAAGLIVEKEAEGNPPSAVRRQFDRFRDRLMIPVRDEQGRMTGFQARALQPDVVPKFMNSPQTALFDKGRTLFGLHLARKAIRDSGVAVVVEGNLDVIAAHQAGFANVVSSQGTALTEHQLRLLKKHAKRILLALDADEAGDAATLRGLMVARDAFDRAGEISFDPRGLVRVEGRLGADIRVMTLPPGLDPDDVIRRSPEEWTRLVEAAESVVEYVIRVLTAGKNLDDPKVKTEVADAVLPLIDDVADPIEREAYRQKLARMLKVNEAVLASRAVKPKPGKRPVSSMPGQPALRQAAPGRAQPAKEVEASRLETYCLGLLLRQPEVLYQLDHDLRSLGLEKLSPDDFTDVELQLLLQALQLALEQIDVEPSEHLRHNLDAVLQARLEALLASEAPSIDEQKLKEDLLHAALRLRRRALMQRLTQLRFLAEDAREQGDALAEAYQPELVRLAGECAKVDRALSPQARSRNVFPKPVA
ncbi:MAG: DNA primase [Anaerolineales bacterium]|nr:DNA primase [Anaerolineales bacterium]